MSPEIQNVYWYFYFQNDKVFFLFCFLSKIKFYFQIVIITHV